MRLTEAKIQFLADQVYDCLGQILAEVIVRAAK